MDRINRTKLITLILVIAVIWYIIYTFPVAPGDFYTPFHVANLFFPNFGIDFEYSMIPDLGKSMVTFYIFNKVMLLFSDGNVMEYYRLVFLTDVLFRFFGYLFLFSVFPELKKFRAIFAIIFTIAIKFPGIPIFLLASILVELIILTKTKLKLNNLIVFILILTMTTFYWHTLSAVATFIISSYLLLLIISKRLSNMNVTHELYLFLISLAIISSSWIYLRSTNMLRVALINILQIRALLSWKYIKLGLFSAGSLVPQEYRFDWWFPLSLSTINIIRWITYMVAYIFLIRISLTMSKTKLKTSQRESIYLTTTALLIADIIDKLAHYFAIKSVGMTVWFVLLYPLFFAYFIKNTFRDSAARQKYLSLRTIINMTVGLLLITSLSLTSGYYVYTTATQLPSTNTPFNMYVPSFLWIVSHFDNGKILSDSDTAGYYEILYAKYKIYHSTPLHFRDIRLAEYDKLYRGHYNPTDQQVIVLNTKLYQEHLVFGSLRYWDRFKPLPPQKIFQNELQIIYSDKSFIIGR